MCNFHSERNVMKPITVVMPIITLFIGLGVGRVSHKGAQVSPPVKSKASIPRDSPQVSALNEQRGGFEPAKHGRSDAAAGASVVSPIQIGDQGSMVLVPSALIGELSLAAGTRTLDQELFGPDGRIEQALGIDDYEREAIQSAWQASRQRIRELEAASMKRENVDEWSVQITVPDISASMASLGHDFGAEVRRALGDNRSEAFLAAKQIESIFSPPVGERSYTVSAEEVGDGEWRFRMILESPGESKVWVGATIPNEIRHLAGDLRLAP
jgi:hypothetical protein